MCERARRSCLLCTAGNFGIEYCKSIYRDFDDKAIKSALSNCFAIATVRVNGLCRPFTTLLLRNFTSKGSLLHGLHCGGYMPGLFPVWEPVVLDGKYCLDGCFTTAGSITCFENCAPIYSICCGEPLKGPGP
jgi:hypothetical protein